MSLLVITLLWVRVKPHEQLLGVVFHAPFGLLIRLRGAHDVRHLRTAQFAEDAGPIAHPVRPESYMEINNFYTLTVYEKGAENLRALGDGTHI